MTSASRDLARWREALAEGRLERVCREHGLAFRAAEAKA